MINNLTARFNMRLLKLYKSYIHIVMNPFFMWIKLYLTSHTKIIPYLH